MPACRPAGQPATKRVLAAPIRHPQAQQEVRALRKLCHPNVVAFYDVLQEGGATYIVMELCQASVGGRAW